MCSFLIANPTVARVCKNFPKLHHHNTVAPWKRQRCQQVIKPKSIEASVAGDTHAATPTRPSDLLLSRPSLRERVSTAASNCPLEGLSRPGVSDLSGISVADDTEIDWSESGPDYHVDAVNNVEIENNSQRTKSHQPPDNDNNSASDRHPRRGLNMCFSRGARPRTLLGSRTQLTSWQGTWVQAHGLNPR